VGFAFIRIRAHARASRCLPSVALQWEVPIAAETRTESVHCGISTYLFHDQRLEREHLAAVAAQGFTAIELFALRTHFDYHDGAAVEALGEWLGRTGLALHSVHAPIAESFANGTWGSGLSIADKDRRAATMREAEAALAIARRIPFPHLVVHVGTADEYAKAPHDNNVEQARRSLEELHALAEPLGVKLALEVIPNKLSSVDGLIRLIEDLELDDAGLCLDFGHAFIMDDVVDAIEAASGHLHMTHVNDNGGRGDDHLVPFQGRIDWPAALFATRKVGYEGLFLFEVAGSPPEEILRRTRRACERFEEILAS
jgi:sugar phosphate isomerase/epimerase